MNIGALIGAAVNATAGGLRGQNKGDDVNYERRRNARQEARQAELDELALYAQQRAASRDQAQIDYYNRGRQKWEPETEEEAIRLAAAGRAPRERNIDPLSPEGIDAEARRQRLLSGIPTRPRQTAGGRPDHTEDIRNLNTVVDDRDREVGRAEKDTPAPWNVMMSAVHPDSAAYENTVRGPQLERIDSLRAERDRFSSTRDSLVAEQFGIRRGGEQPEAAPRPTMEGVDSGSSNSTRPTSSAPMAPPATTGRDPRIAQLETEYARAVAWRGPNGERKDPAALRARFQEHLAQLSKTPPAP